MVQIYICSLMARQPCKHEPMLPAGHGVNLCFDLCRTGQHKACFICLLKLLLLLNLVQVMAQVLYLSFP